MNNLTLTNMIDQTITDISGQNFVPTEKIIVPIINQSKVSIPLMFGKILVIKEARIITANAPPIKPSQVLPGEIRKNNLCLPNKDPAKYAKVSLHQIKNKIPKIIFASYTCLKCPISIRKAKGNAT